MVTEEEALPDGYAQLRREGPIILARGPSGWTTFEMIGGMLTDSHSFCAKCPKAERNALDDFAKRVIAWR